MPPIRRVDSAAVPQTQQSSTTKPAASGAGSFASKLQAAASAVSPVPAQRPSAPAPSSAPAAAAPAASGAGTSAAQSALQEIGAQPSQEDLAQGLREILLQQGLMMGQQIMASGAGGPKIDSE